MQGNVIPGEIEHIQTARDHLDDSVRQKPTPIPLRPAQTFIFTLRNKIQEGWNGEDSPSSTLHTPVLWRKELVTRAPETVLPRKGCLQGWPLAGTQELGFGKGPTIPR